MLSILILTRNEAQNIADCLASVAWSDDIHVLDSRSTDGTQSLATAAGAHVTDRTFDNWSAHQNWALKNLPFQHPWVFYLDADERVTPELRDALLAAAATPGNACAFRVQRRDFFMNTWLKHVQTSPFYLRLFRPESMRYERLVNPVSIPSGPVGQVTGYLDHFPFSKGLDHWLERHRRYAELEAEQTLANRRNHSAFSLRAALFDQDFHRRRFHQKELFYRLPFRPLIRFVYLYILRRGFLDGKAGYTYARLQSRYESWIVARTKEMERS
ncbi:glycosyltransferase family 2 protein [Granulicella paludicola]|uniref:glycosyltransferase family 2 protein n=1 Tax=Granulicella paludicola TaxID=474951 RepID=UPI0021DFC019|nr:glycosyltransferase family 2 protein [Granulicella paludicola]